MKPISLAPRKALLCAASLGIALPLAAHQEASATPRKLPFALCFAPGTDPKRISETEQRLFQRNRLGTKFRTNQRWTRTATNSAGGLVQGDAVTLTWGIVPDGTAISGFSGEAAAPSNLRARLNTLYGSEATWRPLFEQVFARWSQVSGIRYVFQATDDGAPLGTVEGQLGVRADIRIGGHNIDGNNGVLAYNFFPQVGDMVIDTADSFFADKTGNSLGFRNVLAHEHGHGLGFDHVCPITETKLMEPFVSFAFDGPQHDDIRAVQRLYGDAREKSPNPNDTAANATPLGTLGTAQVTAVSIDGLSDSDFYSFQPTASGSKVTVFLKPTGEIYTEGNQLIDGSCSAGTDIDSRASNNLSLELLAANGSTVLASANATGLGGSELIADVTLPAGTGPFFVRVRGASDAVQMYQLNVGVNQTAQAGPSFTVTNTGDNDDGVCSVADCSLREAVRAANRTTGATISFAAAVRGVINLTEALPTLTRPVTINGPGAALLTLRRNAAAEFSVLTSNSTVNIAGLTLTNGNADLGGAIRHIGGTLTVRDCELIANSAGDGGAIYTESGTLNLTRCLVEGNQSDNRGGGLSINTSATIENCTVTNNTAGIQGGAISDWQGNEIITLRHCTIARNRVETDGVADATVSGGIDVFGTSRVTMSHTILALNTTNGVRNDYSGSGINSTGFNLCTTAPPGLTATGDQKSVTDPKLAALAANGGVTRTIALATGSAAINSGNAAFAAPPDTDQRGPGFPRVLGGRIDIGAFESSVSIPSVAMSIADASVTEGSATSPGSLNFVVQLAAPSTSNVTVAFQTGNNSAVAAQDYVAQSGTLTFSPGQTTKTVTVRLLGDSIAELNETFFVDLLTPSGATLSDSRAVGTILNDDGPLLSISNAADVTEGNSGTRTQIFTVRLSAASTNIVTVNFAISHGTTNASDLAIASGTVTFNPGEVSKNISVAINGDTLAEANESYNVVLSNPALALLGTGTARGTIVNDDGPQVFIDNAAPTAEGNSGTKAHNFTVRLSAASTTIVTVGFATADSTADASDYVAASGTVTFNPGETSKVVSVQVKGDTIAEAKETFRVLLSNPTLSVIADNTGVGTIINDDGPQVFIDDAAPVTEGNSGSRVQTFTVRLSAASTVAVSLTFSTVAGTATTADFAAASGSVTFNPGETQKTISVTVLGDTVVEANETYRVVIANPNFAVIADNSGLGTIVNDDGVVAPLQEGPSDEPSE